MRYLSLITVVVLISCNDMLDRSTGECELPYIVVGNHSDSLSIGEVFEVTIQLSDTSLLYMPELNGAKEKVFPLFEINGVLIQDHYSNSYLIRDTVDTKVIYTDYPDYRHVECSILIPHPKLGAGSIKLTRVISYVVKS